MSEIQIWICVSLYLSFSVFTMIWRIRSLYLDYSKRYVHSSKFDNIKSALRDFFNGPMNKAYASIISFLIIIPFLFLSAFFGAILPHVILLVLCFISGIFFLYYFMKSIIYTIRSIRKEKFKTTIKANWQGFVWFFVFTMFVLAYINQINH